DALPGRSPTEYLHQDLEPSRLISRGFPGSQFGHIDDTCGHTLAAKSSGTSLHGARLPVSVVLSQDPRVIGEPNRPVRLAQLRLAVRNGNGFAGVLFRLLEIVLQKVYRGPHAEEFDAVRRQGVLGTLEDDQRPVQSPLGIGEPVLLYVQSSQTAEDRGCIRRFAAAGRLP